MNLHSNQPLKGTAQTKRSTERLTSGCLKDLQLSAGRWRVHTYAKKTFCPPYGKMLKLWPSQSSLTTEEHSQATLGFN